MDSIKLLYFFIYSNTEKEFKYQFMGSMAQLGTWDAVVDLGHGSKGTLSVILFVLFPFLLTGRIDYNRQIFRDLQHLLRGGRLIGVTR